MPLRPKGGVIDFSDNTNKEVELGQRTEGEVGASIDIIDEYVDFVVGYKVRQFNLKIDGEDFQEKQSAPYAGVQVGAYF